MYISMHVLIFQYQRDNLNWFYGHLQFAYDCDPIQLTFLRLLSNHAKQTITYHCLNSTAWFREGSGNYEHSIRLKADNGIEIHAKGTRKYKPTVVLDECQVTRFYSKPIATRLQTIETPLNFISCSLFTLKYYKFQLVSFCVRFGGMLVKPWFVFWRDVIEPNTHVESKLAWYAAEAYHKGTIR